jgi:hypothetical protein
MKWKLPLLPAWAWVSLAALVAVAALGADFVWPRHNLGPPLEARVGFYAGAGFGSALVVLAAAWIARLLRDGARSEP